VEDASTKRVNPFDKFKRKNQHLNSPIKGRSLRETPPVSSSFVPGFDDVSFDAQTRLEEFEPSRAVILNLKEANGDGNSGHSDCDQTGSDCGDDKLLPNNSVTPATWQRTHQKKAKSKRKPMPSDFSRIDRNAYLERASVLIWSLAGYYGITEEESEAELQGMSTLSNEILAHTVNGFEYACDTVRILSSEKEARETVLASDPDLAEFFEKHGVLEEDLEPEEVSTPGYKGVSQGGGRGSSKRSFS
jgi:hypothetical protein